MAGGLLQLVASGNQDLILTYKPEFTFFKKIYHRHTNFSKFTKEIKFKNKLSFGKEGVFLIPKNGDLLDNIYIKINLPSIECKYIRNKYKEYSKNINDLSLNIIDHYDYYLSENLLNNIHNITNNNNKYYIIVTATKKMLYYNNSMYFINSITSKNYTYYLRNSNWYKEILDNNLDSNSNIFYDFNYSDNTTLTTSLNKVNFKIDQKINIYEFYSNYIYGHNYHAYFNYLLYENKNSQEIKQLSPNLYLDTLYEYYKKVIALDINIKSICFLDDRFFYKGENLSTTLNNSVLSNIYIIKITKANIIEDNLDLVLNLSADVFSNKNINNVLKKIKSKSTNTQDEVFNYNFYYEKVNTSLRTDLTIISTLPAKNGFSGTDYNITTSVINGDELILTLNSVTDIEVNDILFAFISTNTSKIYPDAYYKIKSIDTVNQKITCILPIFTVLDSSNIKLFDGKNKLNVANIKNIYSDIFTNYLYIDSLQSNLLSSYSGTEYMSYIRSVNRQNMTIQFQILKNLINSLFKNSNYLSRYYNVDQTSLVVDGSSVKSLMYLTNFTSFKSNFINDGNSSILDSGDTIKYILYKKLDDILSEFYITEPKIWDTYVTGSFKDRDYSILKTRIEQITYLKSTKPYISLTYDSINLSDGTTQSTQGDIYLIYPDNGSGAPDTSVDALAELVTLTNTTITSPSTLTTLTLNFNGEINYNKISIGHFIVKKNTSLYAKITNIYNSYFEVNNVTSSVSKYRGFFYTNYFYNYYVIKLYHELSSSISLITLIFSGQYLLNKSDSTVTTTIPQSGESYFLYNNLTQSITTKLDIVNVQYDGTNTTLKVKINSDNNHNFEIRNNFWLLNSETIASSIGAKIASNDTSKLINLSTKLIHISSKIFEILSQTSYSTALETLIKEATLTYYANYAQLFNTSSIINELFSTYSDIFTIDEIKTYLIDKTIDSVTYTSTSLSTLTDANIIELIKKYLLDTFLNKTTEYEFNIVRGMDEHSIKYFNIIDSLLANEEDIGLIFYNYVNGSNAISKNIIKSKIEASVLKKSESRDLTSTELSTYLTPINTLQTNYNNNINIYEDNKTLLKVSTFDIKTDIYENPATTKSNIISLISSNNLLTSTVSTTIYNDGLNNAFNTDNINNSLYTNLNSIKTNLKYIKFMYLETILGSFLQNKLILKNLTTIININNYISTNGSLTDANKYLKSKNIDEYSYFNINNSDIYIPTKNQSEITTKYNYINDLSGSEKIIENNIYNLEALVRQKILEYYTNNITSSFLYVKELESYLTSNIGGTYKFKFGSILTNAEYTNQNYMNISCYINQIDEYGSIKSLYIKKLEGIVVNSQFFPFDIDNIWISDNISQVKGDISTSGFLLTINTDCLPYPANSGSFPSNKNKNTILPKNFQRNLRLRVGENDNTPTNVTVKDIGILNNGVLLYTIYGITEIPNSDNSGIDTAPTGFNWNPVMFLDRFGSDNLGGSPDISGTYHFYDSTFLKRWDIVGTKKEYYYTTNYNQDIFRHENGHSKILGIMMDGYPLYGPYGHTDPTNNSSDIIRITTSYSLKTTLDAGRPSEAVNSKGSFVQDYEYISTTGKLDSHNGRFCKTPEYPNGTYAYFLTIDSDGKPEFPYIIGSQFKSSATTSSTISPADGTGSNINTMPQTSTDITGFSNNEEVYLGGGSGFKGKAIIKSENNKVILEIKQTGYKYKKEDIIFLRKVNISNTLEYYDNKKIIIKRKSRFDDGFLYDYNDDKLKLIEINETDINQMDNFLLEIKNLSTNGSVTTSTINTAIGIDIFNIIPTHKLIQHIMTINKKTNNFIDDIKKIDINQNINSLYLNNFFIDIFNNYLSFYENDKLVYTYSKDIFYKKYDGNEYNLLNVDFKKYSKDLINDKLNEINLYLSEKIKKLNNNSKNLETNASKLDSILERSDNPSYAWVTKLGNFIFDKINIYMNELLVDSHSSDWVNILYEINTLKSKKKGLDKIIGNLKELYTMNNNIKPQKTLYIPLRFWFCNNPGMNIPIIAMPYVNIKISLNFSEINKLIRMDNGVEIVSNTDITASALINYIYLDENERKLFAESRHEYLIEQVQTNGVVNIYKNTLNSEVKLSFKNNIKDIFYILKKEKDIYLRDRCNYSMNDSDYINGENPIESTTFEFNGRERFKNYSGFYTNYITPYERYISTPSDGINIISFCLNGGQFQPSGSCNFSLVENPYLKVKINSKFLVNESNGKMLVYSRSYNILRIMSGLCGLAFVD